MNQGKALNFSLFVDGLRDRVTVAKQQAIFSKAGVLRDIYIQRKKKFRRRFRFAFIRFCRDEDAWKSIQMFSGVRLEGYFLVVQKAKYQRQWQTPTPATPSTL